MLGIENEGKYYLYRHIRLDKNEPFYIGIGTKGSSKNFYERTKETHSKNNIWKSIAEKTEYIIEIILESNNDLFIQEKEREFIKIYGRICENKGGILANIQDGGRKGNTTYTLIKKIYCCNNNKYYDSIIQASKELNLCRTSISKVLNGRTSNTEGHVFKFTEEDCNKDINTNGWFPIIDEKYGYYINIKKEVKRVIVALNKQGNIVNVKERFLKPVIRKEQDTVQLTLCNNGSKTTINLKKEYKNIFNIDWGNSKIINKTQE